MTKKKIVKDCLKACGLNEDNFPLKSVISRISDCKNKDISPEEFLQNVVRGDKFLRGSIYTFSSQKTALIFSFKPRKFKSGMFLRMRPILFLNFKCCHLLIPHVGNK